MKSQIPPYYFKLGDESGVTEATDQDSREAFEKKLSLLTINEKGGKAAAKAKKAENKIDRQNTWAGAVKRVQCYLGLRDRETDTAFFSASDSMKYKPDASVIFISVDIEAYEFNHKQVTEIGIATLDTLDIRDIAPGTSGKNWMAKIRARHFRIQENKHLINSVHVYGCPDRFNFG